MPIRTEIVQLNIALNKDNAKCPAGIFLLRVVRVRKRLHYEKRVVDLFRGNGVVLQMKQLQDQHKTTQHDDTNSTKRSCSDTKHVLYPPNHSLGASPCVSISALGCNNVNIPLYWLISGIISLL